MTFRDNSMPDYIPRNMFGSITGHEAYLELLGQSQAAHEIECGERAMRPDGPDFEESLDVILDYLASTDQAELANLLSYLWGKAK